MLYFRTTVVAAAAFLDAFQKVADMATNTRGKQMPAIQFNTMQSVWFITICGLSPCVSFTLFLSPIP